MTAISQLINSGNSPFKAEWVSEFTISEVRNNIHYFDFNLFPQDDNKICDEVFETLLQDVFEIRNNRLPSTRNKVSKITRKFRETVYDLVLLAVGNGCLALAKGQVIALRLGKNFTDPKQKQFSQPVIRAFFEAWQANGYAEIIKGDRRYFEEDKFECFSSRLIPLKKFQDVADAFGVVKEDVTKMTNVKLRETKKERVYSKEDNSWKTVKTKHDKNFDLSNFPEIEERSSRLLAVNMFNSTAVVGGRNVYAKGIFTTKNNRKIAVNMNAYTSIYSDDFDHGGRAFAMQGIQSMPKVDRANLTINGEKVAEPDFSSFHPSMLATFKGVALKGYFYDIDSGLGFDHDTQIAINKLVVNTCINSSSKRISTGGIKNRIKDDLGVDLTAQDINKIRRSITKAHPWIEEFFYTGFGLKLMKIESEIALNVMEFMHSKGIHCFNMHDGFIVAEQHRDALIYAMKFWAAHVVGKSHFMEKHTIVSFDTFKVK